MMVFLIIDVIDHPLQVFRSKCHDPVTPLPFESFRLNLVIDVIRARTFQLSDPVGDENIGFEACREVDVGFDTADSVKPGTGRFEDLVAEKMVEPLLDMIGDHWQTVFRVPSDVEVYF